MNTIFTYVGYMPGSGSALADFRNAGSLGNQSELCVSREKGHLGAFLWSF